MGNLDFLDAGSYLKHRFILKRVALYRMMLYFLPKVRYLTLYNIWRQRTADALTLRSKWGSNRSDHSTIGQALTAATLQLIHPIVSHSS